MVLHISQFPIHNTLYIDMYFLQKYRVGVYAFLLQNPYLESETDPKPETQNRIAGETNKEFRQGLSSARRPAGFLGHFGNQRKTPSDLSSGLG